MSIMPGKYQHYKNEDIDDFFTAAGVPYLARKVISVASPLMEITMDGDVMTIKNQTMLKTVEMKFKLGEEYEEQMPTKTTKSVTTIINDNELQTISEEPEDGAKFKRLYTFTEDECIITLTHDRAEKPGKRYFRRVK